MRRQVLIVGDADALRDMVCCAVERTGVHAVCVSEVSDAEPECRRGRFGAMIVLGVSRFSDGRLSVERLRPRGVRRPYIYVLSWHHSEKFVLSLLECGENQYITFPLNLHRLCRKIAEAMNSDSI